MTQEKVLKNWLALRLAEIIDIELTTQPYTYAKKMEPIRVR